MLIETTAALLLILGVLVFFHELGHFLAARLVGIRVEEFAFGFGPRLVRLLKRGDTEYTVHAVPLGGFVKLAGMEPEQIDVPDGFQAQAKWKRAAVIASGPVWSFLLAAVIFIALGTIWGFQSRTNTLNKVLLVNPHTVAAKIGLRAGDEITHIDGRRISTGAEMVDAIHSKPGVQVSLAVKRNGATLTKTAVPGWSIDYLGARWSFMQGDRAVVEGVVDESPAADAGVKTDDTLLSVNGAAIRSGQEMIDAISDAGDRPVVLKLERGGKTLEATAKPRVLWVRFLGVEWLFPHGIATRSKGEKPYGGVKLYDRILRIDGRKVASGEKMTEVLRSRKDGPLNLTVERDGEEIALTVDPARDEIKEPESGLYSAVGLLGFLPQYAFEKTGFAGSIRRGLGETWMHVRVIMFALAPSRISESVGGPVMIAKQTHTMVSLGPYYVVWMAGMLSMSLAFINLFPIPVLDGGHLLILLVELVRRKRLTPEQTYRVMAVGLTIILALVVVIVWADITRIAQGRVPQ